MVGRILRPGDERDVLAARFEIEKEDVFHVKNIYEWMHDWLEDHDWVDTDGADNTGGDKFEHYYWEKRTQEGHREHRMWWRIQKFPTSSDYFRFVLLINFRNLKSQKTEIVYKGQKVKTWKGDLTMLIESWLQLDYKNLWKNHWLLKHIDPLYRKRIWMNQREKWKKDLWRRSYRFASWIKQYLNMKIPFKRPEPFHEVGGVGQPPSPGADIDRLREDERAEEYPPEWRE